MTQVRGWTDRLPVRPHWEPTQHPHKEPSWDGNREVAQLEAHWALLARGDIQTKGMFEIPVLPAVCRSAGNKLQPLQIFILSRNLLPVEQDAPQNLPHVTVTQSAWRKEGW